MAKHNELGAAGEKIAKKHLEAAGYEILELNYRFKRDEIDIIAKHKEEVVFVEVKTRASDFFEAPQEAVTMAKQKRLINAANNYLISNNLENEARFDIFAIILSGSKEEINHITNAFQPIW